MKGPPLVIHYGIKRLIKGYDWAKLSILTLLILIGGLLVLLYLPLPANLAQHDMPRITVQFVVGEVGHACLLNPSPPSTGEAA